MLFIISTNDPQRNDNSLLSWSTLSWSLWEAIDSSSDSKDKELDNLVKKVNEDDNKKLEELNESASWSKGWSKWLFSFFNRDRSNDDNILTETSVWNIGNEIENKDINEIGQEAIEEKSEWIFNKLFRSKDEIIKEEDKLESKENTKTSANEVNSTDTESEIDLAENTWEVTVSSIVNTWGNLSKTQSHKAHTLPNASEAYMNQYAKEDIQISIPMVQPGLKTQVGKNFQIGVYSLKLNNADFNQTLAYMSKWDIVKQHTEENIYGCFLAEIITSRKNHYNIGKKGYVCKGYLRDVIHTTMKVNRTQNVKIPTPTVQKMHKSEINQSEKILPEESSSLPIVNVISDEARLGNDEFLPPEENRIDDNKSFLPQEINNTSATSNIEGNGFNFLYKDTKVWDVIVLQSSAVNIWGYTVHRGDYLDQTSPSDANGCFEVYVHKIVSVYTNPEAQGKTGRVCIENLK